MSPPDPEDRGGREDERRKRPEVRQRLVMISSDNVVCRFSITSQERSLAGGQAPRMPGGQGVQTPV